MKNLAAGIDEESQRPIAIAHNRQHRHALGVGESVQGLFHRRHSSTFPAARHAPRAALSIMKLLVLVAALASLIPIARSDDQTLTFKTTDGRQFKNVALSRADPDGISIVTDDGIEKIPYKVLPADLQARFKFDPAKASAFQKKVELDQAAFKKQAATAEERLHEKKATEEAAEKYKKAGIEAEVRRIQVLESGSLATILGTRGQTVFIIGLTNGVDGDVSTETIFPAGKYKYISTTGAARTVRAYATDWQTGFREFMSQPAEAAPAIKAPAPEPPAKHYENPLSKPAYR